MCLRPLEVFIRPMHPFARAGTYTVPCGKCIQCTSRAQNDWRFRLIQQTLSTPKCVFGTLTYKETTLPMLVDKETGECTPTVFKEDVQKWLHRSVMRLTRSGIDEPMYFLASEYGTHTFRPHYHFLFWNVNRMDFEPCLVDWREKYGFEFCTDVDVSKIGAAAVYVSKYALKGQFDVSVVKNGLAAPNFHLVSKGVGKAYLDEIKSYCRKHHFDKVGYSKEYLETLYNRLNYVTPDGRVFALPRYYVNKIIPPKTRLAFEYSAYVRDRRAELDELRDRKIADSLSIDMGQAHIVATKAKIAENMENAKSLLERQNNFYNKSKL